MKGSTKKLLVPFAAVALLVAACNGDTGNGDDNGAADDGDNGAEVEAGDGDPLQLGYVLPETGDLAFLGPPQIEATNYAISQINEAGGVLGAEMPDPVGGDEGADQAVASQSTDLSLIHI